MNWKIGQKLVCIKRGGWIDTISRLPAPGPKYNEVVEFNGPCSVHEGSIDLKEYPTGSYVVRFFRPVESHSAHISEAVRSSLPAIIEIEQGQSADIEQPQPEPVAICGNTNPLASLITMINTDGTMVAAGGKVPIWVVMK